MVSMETNDALRDRIVLALIALMWEALDGEEDEDPLSDAAKGQVYAYENAIRVVHAAFGGHKV
jgi:hypothetical protein